VAADRKTSTTMGACAAVVLAVLLVALFVPAPASAGFSQPFRYQLSGTSPTAPFSGPGGLAVDSEDNLWVAELNAPPFRLDQFESSGTFKGTRHIGEPPLEGLTPPASLAVDHSTTTLYTTGSQTVSGLSPSVEEFTSTGAFVRRWAVGSGAHVALDNSTEPSAGSIYVATRGGRVISKFNAAGEAQPFEGCEESGHPCSYVSANKITGTPSGSFTSGAPQSVTVDSHGDIYTLQASTGMVLEYGPSGLFIASFSGAETPGLGESHNHGGFGGALGAVAVDPINGEVFVSVTGVESSNANLGAIDAFDSSGHFLHQTTETAPGHHLHSASEMTVDSHGDLYVVDSKSQGTEEHAVNAYGPLHFVPGLKLEDPTERQPTEVLLHGSVNPDGRSLTDCHFEFVPQSQFEASGFESVSAAEEAPCVPAAASIPANTEYHPVDAEATGLSSGTTYRFRLVATSSGELGGTGASEARVFTAPGKPRVDSSSATNLSSTFADLGAQIDPLGAATTYQFQYVDEAHYEPGAEDPYAAGASAPAVAAGIGSGGPTGSAEEAVLQHISGLVPGNTYHFHVVASNEDGVTNGPDQTFTTFSPVVPGLPDNRAYELVTPPNKAGGSDMFAKPETNGEFSNGDVGYPTVAGDGFLLQTKAAFGPFPGSEQSAYAFSRTASGWGYTSLASPSLGLQSIGEGTLFAPEDLSRVAVNDNVGAEGGEGGSRLTSLVGPPGGPYTTLHVDAPFHLSTETHPALTTNFVGSSHDLSHLVLESNDHTLCPGAEAQEHGEVLCESTGGGLKLVNVNSEGHLLSRCGATLGEGIHGQAHNAVSADGSRIFFTAPDPGRAAPPSGPGCWNGATEHAPQLYLRTAGQTFELSEPEPGVTDPTGQHHSQYVGASEDGSRVFFVTETELTKDDEGIHDLELYEWEAEGTGGCAQAKGCLIRVSRGESGETAAGVYAVPAVSADGSAVYFSADGVLAHGAQPGHCSTDRTSTCNLYRYDTATNAITYIATVNAIDLGDQSYTSIGVNSRSNSYTTPGGRYALFASSRALTGYSTARASSSDCRGLPDTQGESNGHCDELYRYDSATAGLTCVSCNPSGAPPVSNALFDRSVFESPAGPPRAMSNDGSYVFFDSADALVPQDTNGTLDVYQWHEGRISLISSGHDSAPSFFLGASSDGSNVFFGTHARLVSQDTDSNGDIYDARIGGGFPPPPSTEGLCEGDACAPSIPAPNDPTPSSLSFQGAGNVTECPKGKVKQKGRCVKKHKAKKHHKKHKKHHKKKSHKRHAKVNRGAGK
jgi:hypothetical protein